MNEKYLEKARQRISNPKKLVICSSRRAKQLAQGARPMIKTDDENPLDVALLEIAEGLLDIEEPKKS